MLKLKVTHIPTGKNTAIPLDEKKNEFLIGRVSNADIFLDDPYVSRFHAKLFRQGDKFFITDQASSGGTKLNDLALTPLATYLVAVGATVVIGSHLLQLEEGSPVLTQSPPEESKKSVQPKREDKWKQLTVECVRIVAETHDVKTFYFHAPQQQFHYKPGQFVTLNLQIDNQEVLRSYSISSTPSRPDTLEITIKRVPSSAPDVPPGLVSNWMHDHLKVGNKIIIDGPMGKFTCADHPAKKLFFISAGSGITPMMAMSRWITDRVLDRDIIFFHAARTVEDIIYRQELEWMSSRFPNFHLFITTTRSNLGFPWAGLRGRLSPSMLHTIAPDFTDRAVYVCGPDEFMAATKLLLQQEGYPMTNYHEESFGGPKKAKPKVETEPKLPVSTRLESTVEVPKGIIEEVKNIKPSVSVNVNLSTEPLAREEGKKVSATQTVVVFQKSGKEVAASSDDLILDLAEQEGVKIRSSCRVGTCGTCKKRKISGEVRFEDYDPEALEAEEVEEGFILTCVAHPIGGVVIDA